MPLPSHVKGWDIPSTKTESGLTVVRAESLWGYHYEVGQLDDAMTRIDPKAATAWLVESDERPGVTVMEATAKGGWNAGFRAAAAMMHFCAEEEDLLGSNREIRISEHTVDRMDLFAANLLRNIGFRTVYGTGNLTADPAAIREFTTERFPEFAQAQPIPATRNVAA